MTLESVGRNLTTNNPLENNKLLLPEKKEKIVFDIQCRKTKKKKENILKLLKKYVQLARKFVKPNC